MGRKDHCSKQLLNDPRIVADIVNYLFEDKKISVAPNDIRCLANDQSVIIGKKTDHRIRDRLWLVTISSTEQPIQLILGIELQSEINYAMPVRAMHYDALSYQCQLEAIKAQKLKRNTLSNAASFLSGITKRDKIIPVVTTVPYFGKEPWDGAVTLKEMFPASRYKSIYALSHQYVLHLIDPHRLSVSQLLRFQTELREVFAFIKYADDKPKLVRFLNRFCQNRTISGNAVDVINTFTKAGLKKFPKQEAVQMCQAIIDLKNEAREEGHRAGKREGKREGKLENLLANIRALNKTLGLTYEDAMKALRIPKAKREELLKLLPASPTL